MVLEHESLTWKTKFCWQRELRTEKEAFVILAIDAMLRLGLVRIDPGENFPTRGRPPGPEHPQ